MWAMNLRSKIIQRVNTADSAKCPTNALWIRAFPVTLKWRSLLHVNSTGIVTLCTFSSSLPPHVPIMSETMSEEMLEPSLQRSSASSVSLSDLNRDFVHRHFPSLFRATAPCTLLTLQLPKVLRTWGILCILTWNCASRHNAVHFFISLLARWLRAHRFSEPTVWPSRITNHRKI